MAERPPDARILIAGGYGTFGQRLARELLAHSTATVVLAGRNVARAQAARREIEAYGGRGGFDWQGRVELAHLDLARPGALAAAAAGCAAVACAAGPFQALRPDLPRQAVGAGAHWLDLADYHGWVRPLLQDEALHREAAAGGCVVIPGLSTIPALSGVLVRWCRERLPAARGGRVILAIGNRNPKGAAAVASALGAGFAAPRRVPLPVGPRIAYRFTSPEAALLADELGLELAFLVAFEPVPGLAMAAASRLGVHLGFGARMRLATWLARLAEPISHLGSPASCLQVQLEDTAGGRVMAALVASGQRLAVLPCALAVEALLAGELQARGVVHPVTWRSTGEWLARLQARDVGFTGSAPGPRPATGAASTR
jgi:hypothetical protein